VAVRTGGAVETVDHTAVSLVDAVRQAHPHGIDVLVDLASDADAFSALASLVQPGGTALTTRYVADAEELKTAGVSGINFTLQPSSELLERVADAVVAGRILAPPIPPVGRDLQDHVPTTPEKDLGAK
jgi:NADPH:quinone reductase